MDERDRVDCICTIWAAAPFFPFVGWGVGGGEEGGRVRGRRGREVKGAELSYAIYEGSIPQEGVTVYMEQGSPKLSRVDGRRTTTKTRIPDPQRRTKETESRGSKV